MKRKRKSKIGVSNTGKYDISLFKSFRLSLAPTPKDREKPYGCLGFLRRRHSLSKQGKNK